ncbi:hypothetical protein HOY80DRAFT_998947 [Tuber brumale]|nr:hypothetical protein HOY80DRAFT_998947 [Tuber brumale]
MELKPSARVIQVVIDQLDGRHRHYEKHDNFEIERRLYRPSSIKLDQFGGTQHEAEFSNIDLTYLGHKHLDEAPTNVAQQSSGGMASTTTSHGTATRDHLRDAVLYSSRSCMGVYRSFSGGFTQYLNLIQLRGDCDEIVWLDALLVVLPWLGPPPIIYWSPSTGALNPAKLIHRIISEWKAGHAVVTGKRNTGITDRPNSSLHHKVSVYQCGT